MSNTDFKMGVQSVAGLYTSIVQCNYAPTNNNKSGNVYNNASTRTFTGVSIMQIKGSDMQSLRRNDPYCLISLPINTVNTTYYLNFAIGFTPFSSNYTRVGGMWCLSADAGNITSPLIWFSPTSNAFSNNQCSDSNSNALFADGTTDKMWVYIGFDSDYKLPAVAMFRTNATGTPTPSILAGYSRAPVISASIIGNNDYYFEIVNSSEAYGEASDEGGYTGGTFDDSSDVIAMPSVPSMGVTSAGFVNVYSPTQGELQNFGAELFPDLSFVPDTPVSPTSGIQEAIEAMANVFVTFGNQIPNIVDMFINSNLIQYVIDCHILPVAPMTGGTANIKVGFKQFTPAPAVVTSDYVDFDCGSLNIGEYYANFIDYAPYTKSKLFLPFVGFVDLAPEFWQAGTLSVKYRFNIIDGSFMAFVIATSSKSKLSNSVVAQFGGNACVHIPITGLNYSSMVSGVVGAAAGIATAQSGVQAASKAIGGAVDVANSKPPMQQSNGYNATTSFLGVRTPYLMIERSVANFSVNYPNEMGIPSNITSDFSKLSGYTKATNIHLDGIAGATQTELDEIAALLAEGVIL